MLAVFKLIEQIARTDSTVLVTGESGTGKEWVARAIHFYSLRRDRPFVALNCGAIPETLLESELFGHMKGSFTGASVNKKGLIEVGRARHAVPRRNRRNEPADAGEAAPRASGAEVPPARGRRRARGGDPRHRGDQPGSRRRMVAEGKFREDLFYRINVIPIHLPPLRERGEDIPLLADYFLAKYREQMGKAIHGLSQESMTLLEAYEWPGNIRELENVIERAVALEKSQAILPESLPEHIVKRVPKGPAAAGLLPESGFNLEEHVEGLEKEYITQALQRAGRPGEGRRAAGHPIPVVPLLRQEIQPQVACGHK